MISFNGNAQVTLVEKPTIEKNQFLKIKYMDI